MQQYSMIYNRLVKNKKKLKNYLKTHKIQAYRLYDKDIPELPFIVDIYGDCAVVYEKGIRIQTTDKDLLQKSENNKKNIVDAITQLLGFSEDRIIFKSREIMKGKSQYIKISKENNTFEISEGDLKFYVNLNDYLDTGLFLDHRPLREKLVQVANNKKVLNLFSYTGSLSVASAAGGALTTTVDMSKTYIEWAKDNFQLNNLTDKSHEFIQADVLKFVDSLKEKYDIIILDPPSFSNSKRMDETFDVQRDHEELIEKLMRSLNKNGVLIFSNNNRKFKLSEKLAQKFSITDTTAESIPPDFRDKKIHVCFEIKKAP